MASLPGATTTLPCVVFLPHPYPECFWEPQPSVLPPEPTVSASCLTLSGAERSITLFLPSPYSPHLPTLSHYCLSSQAPSGADLRECSWEVFQEKSIYIEMGTTAAPFYPHRSADIHSLKEIH